MESDDLKVFARVAAELSITRAAARLGRAKSTVSRQIARLERAAGGPLLDRGSGRVRLTPLGVALAAEAAAVEAALARARAVAEEGRAAVRGRIRVNVPHIFANCFLTPRLPDFIARHPGMDVVVDLAAAPTGETDAEADIVVRAGDLANSAMKARKLGYSELRLYAAPVALARCGPQAARAALETAGAFAARPLTAYRAIWDVAAPGPLHRLEVWEPCLRHALTVRGAGAAWLPAFLALPDVAAGTLVDLAPGEARGPIPVHALFNPGVAAAPTIRAFLDFLTDCARPLAAVDRVCTA